MITALSEIEANAEKYEDGVLFLSKKAARYYEFVLQAVTAHLINQQRELMSSREMNDGKYSFFPYEIQFMINVLNLEMEHQNLKFGAVNGAFEALSRIFSRIKDDHFSVEKEEHEESDEGVTISAGMIDLSPLMRFGKKEDDHDE